jgi:flavodoxin
MKRFLLTLLVFCFASVSAFPQTANITLSDTHPTREVTIPSFNMSELGRFVFTKGETDGNGNAEVVIEIENNSNEFMFLLFNKYYRQDELRRQRPRIVFGKLFPGNSIEKVEGSNLTEIKIFPFNDRRYAQIEDNVYRFPRTTIKEGESKEYVIPLYLAKKKKCLFGYKIELVGKTDLNFNIFIEQSDKDYDRIKVLCDSIASLMEKVKTEKPFCTHRSHLPSYSKQIEPSINRILNLQDLINHKLTDRNIHLTDARREQYENLLDALEKAQNYLTENYEHDCGEHIHHCDFCKLSLEQIYRKMDNYYIELKNANAEEFADKKKAIMIEANRLYKCCTDPTCSKHASQWKQGGQIKQKIVERFEQLKKL